MPDSSPATRTAAPTQRTTGQLAHEHAHTKVGPDYRQRTVSVPGGPMMVGIWGPRDPHAPEILTVHGVSASHRSFGLLAEALPGVRIIAPDLRGRGRSNQLPGPYGMPIHADDMAAVLSEVATGPVTVAGHSMGAFVTLVLAHRHPHLVRSAVLIDGGVPLQVPVGLDPDQMVQAILGPAAERLAMQFTSVDEYRDFWLQHPAFAASWRESRETAALMEDYIRYDLDQREGSLRPSTRYEAMAQDTAELQGGGSLLEALESLDVPTRLLWTRRGLLGEEPGLYSQQYLSGWLDEVPALAARLCLEEVPETNHYTIAMTPAGADAVARSVHAAWDHPQR